MKEVTMQQIVDEWDAILPHWAVRKAKPGILEAGTQLCTKDGRRHGNATIIEIVKSKFDDTRPYYRVLTDAGTLMIMNSSEIYSGFHDPQYIVDVSAAVAKFGWTNQELIGWKPEAIN